jgi:hypothetical protein
VQRIEGPVAIATAVVAGLAIAAGLVYLRRHEERLADKAERSLPGPLDEPSGSARAARPR